MPPPRSEFEAEMQHLQAEIKRLEAEYNMYFAGRLARPPVETKNRVHALVKRYDNAFIRNTADRFRFEMLQTRYYKFLELVEKQMTARELGRPGIGRPAKAPPPPAQPVAPPPATPAEAAESRRSAQEAARAKADESIVKFGRTDDTGARAKELYEQLAAAKKKVGEEPVSFDRVQALVKAQVQKLGADGNNVAFKIGMKDGKVQLTVKAEKDTE